MATQQRSVIVTAIVLAIILGGALVWLLNRTPADQLATQAPAQEVSQEPQAEAATTVSDGQQLAQAQGQVQGVAATAPTGPAENFILMAMLAAALGSGGLLALMLPRLEIFRG